MSRRIKVRRYAKPAMVLHWAAAIGIFGLFAHGFLMMRLPDHERIVSLGWHRSVGIAVLLCVLLRIWWRATHPPPRAPQMPKWQERLAHFTHVWLYVLIVANGVAGIVGWIFGGDPIVFFGMPVPALAATDTTLHRLCHIVSFATSRALAVTIGLHVAAALKHQFVDRDRLLARMWVSFTRIDYQFDARRDPRYRAGRAMSVPAGHAARDADRAGSRDQRPSPMQQIVDRERSQRAHARRRLSSGAAGHGYAGRMSDHAQTIQVLLDRIESFAARHAQTSPVHHQAAAAH